MTKGWIDADAILNRASRWSTQKGHEMQRFWHLVKLRIALAENVRKEGVDDLNQLLADVMPARFVQEAPLGGNGTHVLPMMARRSAEGGDDEWY